jgi:hypothetical protein
LSVGLLDVALMRLVGGADVGELGGEDVEDDDELVV